MGRGLGKLVLHVVILPTRIYHGEYCCRSGNLTSKKKSELDWCYLEKNKHLSFRTLSDQPGTFNPRTERSLRGTADKTSLSRRSVSGVLCEVRERGKKEHFLFAPTAQSEQLNRLVLYVLIRENNFTGPSAIILLLTSERRLTSSRLSLHVCIRGLP